jgi:uncharacterized protein (TIGR01777 family)
VQILVTGASGFIGQHLLPLLHFRGHKSRTLSRTAGAGDAVWQPDAGQLDARVLDGIDAVVHLAGEPVAERWNSAKKEKIQKSRSQSGLLLSRAIASMPAGARPRVVVSASAIGYYGNRGSEVLDESSPPGRAFLSKVCLDWEEALKPAADVGVRCATVRMGIVLSTTGGALPRIMKGMNMHAGGRLGNGQQYMSWVTIEDTVAAIDFLIEHDNCRGAYNVVAPEPVTNAIFVSTLAEIMHCDRLMPVPAAMAQFAFGHEMANELLLASTRVQPERLVAEGFRFKYPSLKGALEHLIRDRS